MECKEAREEFWELMGRPPEAPRRRKLTEHLKSCAACSEQFADVQEADNVLRKSINELAPRGSYLTDDRRENLMCTLPSRRSDRPILTMRRFVAAAAIAVILVCSFYIAKDIYSLGNDPQEMYVPRPAWQAANASGNAMPLQIGLVSLPEKDSTRIVPGYVIRGARDQRGMSLKEGSEQTVHTSSKCVEIPVKNRFYEREQDRYWW
ncbi:MAG: hypothetical protein ACLFWL_13885 [Candidatus Brocadiia bacterium]